MMKLIIAQPYINLKGGAERVFLKIAQHYEAPIYTLEYTPKDTFPEFKDVDVKIVGKDVPFAEMLPYRASQGLRYGYNFYNLKLKEDYDVINAHISPSEWIRHKNARVLWYCHTPPREVYDLYETRMKHRSSRQKFLYSSMTKMYKLIANRVIKNIEVIAANSAKTQSNVKKFYGRDSTIIYPGVEPSEFNNEAYDKYFFYPSRFVVNKRQEYVINAFRQFSARSKRNYSLVLAGTLSKDPEHQAYYNKLKKLAHGLKVEMKTNVSDREIRRLHASATAMLFSGQNEEHGISLLEGMASGKPVISVNEGGPRDIVEDGKTGFLVGSEKEMAERMLQLSGNASLTERMGHEARKRVESTYSWEIFFRKFDRLLEETKKKSV